VNVLRWLYIACLIGSGLGNPIPADAKPRLNSIFTDHAVLLRDRPIEIWGTATPSERVIISIGDQSIGTDADSKGNWRAQMAPMKAGGPFVLSVRASPMQVTPNPIGRCWPH
jgi:sialate O-acetylesterase